MTNTKLLNPQDVFLDLDVATREDLFAFVGAHAQKAGVTLDARAIEHDLMEREGQVTTGLTDSFAIPHARSGNVREVRVLFIRTTRPLDWEMMDESLPQHFFVLLVPEENEGNIHLRMISALAVNLLDDDFRNRVTAASDEAELAEYINSMVRIKGEQQ